MACMIMTCAFSSVSCSTNRAAPRRMPFPNSLVFILRLQAFLEGSSTAISQYPSCRINKDGLWKTSTTSCGCHVSICACKIQGPNPYDPNKTSATSALGDIAFCWFEGDGMLHATYFRMNDEAEWSLSYKNKYTESKTFLMQKRNKGLFLPAALGQPAAVFLAIILNKLRYGEAAKQTNNTNVFEHAGRVYTIAENHLPHEIDPSSLDTLKVWDVNGSWNRPFTSHPKRAPGSGELVIMGVDLKKPYNVIGVISADGTKMVHKADLKFETCFFVHEHGVTENFNIIMDYPLGIGVERLLQDKQFVGYEEGTGECRIGVMPRYGYAEDINWFKVKSHCSFHIINTFEDADEVVVRGCRTSGSIVFGPHHKFNKAEWYKRAYTRPPSEEAEGFDPSIDGVLFSLLYEWRLNLNTGEVKERFLTSPDIAMDFPSINNDYAGIKNKYAYVQVVDSVRSANTGMPIFNKFAKLHFDDKGGNEVPIEVEYHVLEKNHFCSGLQFVKKPGGIDEDDGWIVSYVHDEDTNVSKVYIVDAKKFTEGPVAKIDLPQRVPYGFHGTFIYE